MVQCGVRNLTPYQTKESKRNSETQVCARCALECTTGALLSNFDSNLKRNHALPRDNESMSHLTIVWLNKFTDMLSLSDNAEFVADDYKVLWSFVYPSADCSACQPHRHKQISFVLNATVKLRVKLRIQRARYSIFSLPLRETMSMNP